MTNNGLFSVRVCYIVFLGRDRDITMEKGKHGHMDRRQQNFTDSGFQDKTGFKASEERWTVDFFNRNI